MTDVELILNRDIDTLRTRHGAMVNDYVRKVFDFPELTNRIQKTFWARMRTVEIDERETTNTITGERQIISLMYRQLNRAGCDNVRRAGLWPEFLARGEAALSAGV